MFINLLDAMRKQLSQTVAVVLLLSLMVGACGLNQGEEAVTNETDAITQDDLLIAAARDGKTGTVHELLEAGASPDASYDEGTTALMQAALMGRTEIVGVLLDADAGADPNAANDSGVTALADAASRGHVGIVERLLANGAAPDSNIEGVGTPLLIATVEGHARIVDALLNAGADPNVENSHGWTPLRTAEENGNEQIAARLREAGAQR